MSDRILKITQETHYRFLNFYKMLVKHRNGGQSEYYVSSRAKDISEMKINTRNDRPDGVAIYAVCQEDMNKVVLIRQFRYPIDDYIYEFPAGLMEEGEDIYDAAIREFYEETGMTFEPVRADESYTKARFMTSGMTDECCATVFGYAKGTPSTIHQEDTEDIQVVIADKDEVRRIMKEEKMAIICTYQMMHFLTAQGDPFAFLKCRI